MKKVIVMLIALFAINEVSAQWETIPTPDFPNPWPYYNCSYKFAMGSNSTFYCFWQCEGGGGGGILTMYKIYRTADNGLDWVIKLSDIVDGSGIQSMYFISGDTGYFMRENYAPYLGLKRTSDGLSSTISCDYCYLTGNQVYKMIDVDTMLHVLHNSNSAHSFNKMENDTLKTIYFFPQPNNFICNKIEAVNYVYYLMGIDYNLGSDLVLKSIDGGYSWDTSYYNPVQNLLDIKFFSDSIGFMVGYNGKIYKTENAGTTWELKETPTNNNLLSIDYMNEFTWIAAGGSGTILVTFDGGNTWHQKTSSIGFNISEIRFPEKDGTIVILAGDLYKTNLDYLTSLPDMYENSNYFKLSPNPAKDWIIISISELTANFLLSIFNVRGEKILERQLTDNETQLDISALPRGVYFVRVQDEKGVQVAKMVKE